jgi:hypothetical protein
VIQANSRLLRKVEGYFSVLVKVVVAAGKSYQWHYLGVDP